MKKLFILLQFCFITIVHSYSQNSANSYNPEKKMALVIGVSKYKFADPLKNTLNDANDIAADLKKNGFRVTLLLEPTLQEMSAAVDLFGQEMSRSTVCLFYFSGHGAEYSSENYLFPVNAHPTAPGDLQYETFPLGKVLSRIHDSGIKTSIILLDACRNNPFRLHWTRSYGSEQGLSVIDSPPNGSFIGYAAAPGKVASDGNGRHGAYTGAILKYIDEKNQSIDQLFNKVNKEVRAQTDNYQTPFKSSSLDDDFYFCRDESIKKDSQPPLHVINEEFSLLKVVKRRFPMPQLVKGAALRPINDQATVFINKSTFEANDIIELNLALTKDNIWDRTTPLYVMVTKATGKSKEIIDVLENQYQPTGLRHTIKLSANFGSGVYDVRIGFYFISELNTEYPPFYSRAFTIHIQ